MKATNWQSLGQSRYRVFYPTCYVDLSLDRNNVPMLIGTNHAGATDGLLENAAGYVLESL